MELKTLKDIIKNLDYQWKSCCYQGNQITLEEFVNDKLKQLVIIHIKHMRREGRDLYNSNIDEKSAIPKLMEIFNLNEEDLKDGKRKS